MTALDAAAVLAKARDVLADKGWSHCGAKGPNGEVCTLIALHDAAEAVSSYDWFWQARNHLYRAIWGRDADGLKHSVGEWNDDPSTTYEDVISALKEAEELAAEVSQ